MQNNELHVSIKDPSHAQSFKGSFTNAFDNRVSTGFGMYPRMPDISVDDRERNTLPADTNNISNGSNNQENNKNLLFENELVDDGMQVDMHYLYKRSYNELHAIYKNEFIHSESCAMLVK